MRIFSFLVFFVSIGVLPATSAEPKDPQTLLKITSPDFIEGGDIPEKFTCDGANTSPGLKIEGVPEAAKSLVLIMDDPDAPAGTWNHWLVWNLKTDLKEILKSSLPQDAVQGLNDFRKNNYGGPCPPSGTHRYYFRLYALDFAPHLPPGTNRKALDKAIEGHALATAVLMGRYSRAGK